ncbi:MAG: hypothetical protein QW103_01150 [Candidatus Pacearchaeota archaeon]
MRKKKLRTEKIYGIENIRERSIVLEKYPLYRPSIEFVEEIKKSFENYKLYGFLEKYVFREIIYMVSAKNENILLLKNRFIYSFSYNFFSEQKTSCFLVTTIPSYKFNFVFGKNLESFLKRNEFLPTHVFINDKYFSIKY